MRVSKWGNTLAIRLPASVVRALALKEGDEVEIHVVGDRAFGIDRDRSRERALATHPRLSQNASSGLEVRPRGCERQVSRCPASFEAGSDLPRTLAWRATIQMS